MTDGTHEIEESAAGGGLAGHIAIPKSSPHDGCERGFTQLSKAWYGPANLTNPKMLDSIMVGFYAPEGDTSGEFEIVWEKLSSGWAPRLNAFDDGWSALFNFGDMLESMADIDGKNVDPDEFASLLEELGIKNMTPTEAANNVS